MIGFKFGEFTWNRKLALYKAKQLKKKKKITEI
jgi:ribosomal protein S19